MAGMTPSGNKAFPAVQHIRVSVLHRVCCKRRKVRTRFRFGHADRNAALTLADARYNGFFLLLRPENVNDPNRPDVGFEHRRRDHGAELGQFLNREDRVERRLPPAAVLGGNSHPQQSEIRVFFKQVVRKFSRLIDMPGQFLEFFPLAHGPDGFNEHFLFFV